MPILGEDSRGKNGGQGQVVGHKEIRKQVSVTSQTQKVNWQPLRAHPPLAQLAAALDLLPSSG